MFAGKKSAQIREILISESAWEEMTCLFAPSLKRRDNSKRKASQAYYLLSINYPINASNGDVHSNSLHP
ncbi:hypothetical protein ZK87_23470 [Salmonella enterica subsp. enterica serovar Enteritidis]|nr:hypothetical protein [Salmonella enterica subsp. enterica serovar Enteritidis]ECN9061908.1 hypothetical protein [Salmonella enterica subsp. enterica serovar Enteritidis]